MKKISVVLLALFIYHGIFAQENDSLKRITAKHLVALDSIKKQLDNQLLTKIEKAQQEKVSQEILDSYLEEYEDQMDYALYEEFLMLRKELGIEDSSDEKDDFSWRKVVIKVLEKSDKEEKKPQPSGADNKDTKKKEKTSQNDRTSTELYIGLGINSFYENSPSDYIQPEDYSFQKSGFVELSWIFKFYMDKHNRSYINTGVGVMWNKLSPGNNKYHVVDNGDVKLAGFSEDLSLSKMRTAWLKIPLGLGFEVPVSKKLKLKFGASVYGKMKIGSIQKMEYTMDGAEYSVKEKRDFLQEKFNYGAQAHIGLNGIEIYGGMDFAPYFMNQSGKMYFVGIRL